MQRRLTWLVLLSVAIATATGSAMATPPEGFTSTTLAQAPFSAIDVSSYFINDKGKVWLSFQKTKRKVRRVCPDQCLAGGRKHGLARPPKLYLGLCHSGRDNAL